MKPSSNQPSDNNARGAKPAASNGAKQSTQHGKGLGNKPVAPRNEPSKRRADNGARASSQASERADDEKSSQSSTRKPTPSSTRIPAEEEVREQVQDDGAGQQIPRPNRTTR